MKRRYTSEQLLEIYRRIELPDKKMSANLDQIPEYDYKKEFRSYLDGLNSSLRIGEGLILYGPYSTGKSSLAAIVLKEAVLYGCIGFWVRGEHLTAAKMEGKMFDEKTTVIDRCLEVPLLVIDELHLREKTVYSNILVDEIIRERIDYQLPTVLTMNFGLAELEENYPSISAILDELGKRLHVTGKDFRRGGNTKKPKIKRNSDGTTDIF